MKRVHGMSALLLASLGCSSSEPTPPVATANVPVVVGVKPANPTEAPANGAANPEPAPNPVTQPPTPAETPMRPEVPKVVPVPFQYAADRGGKVVEQTLTPSLPSPLPVPRLSQHSERLNRTAVRDVVLSPVNAVLPVAPLPARKVTLPPTGPEPLPGHQERLILEELAKMEMPTTPAIVSPPRPGVEIAVLPTLASQSVDRVSTADPTEAISTRAIIHTPMSEPELMRSFLKWSLPNPFEWAEQIRQGGVPEWAMMPVPVTPERR